MPAAAHGAMFEGEGTGPDLLGAAESALAHGIRPGHGIRAALQPLGIATTPQAEAATCEGCRATSWLAGMTPNEEDSVIIRC